MSRIVPAEELNLIERVISEYPEGIWISALEKMLHHDRRRKHRAGLQARS